MFLFLPVFFVILIGGFNSVDERSQFWKHLIDLRTIDNQVNCINDSLLGSENLDLFDLAVMGKRATSMASISPMFTNYKSGGIYIIGNRSIGIFESSIYNDRYTKVTQLNKCGDFRVLKVVKLDG